MNCKSLIVGLVYGGKSCEHEVSCESAIGIRKGLRLSGYEVVDLKLGRNNEFDLEKLKQVDVIFSVVHGSYGEDGCLQGMFEILGKPYVGTGVLGSAVGMDKDVQRRLLKQKKISVTNSITLNNRTFKTSLLRGIKFPVFVKPANMGSSVGVNKCNYKKDLQKYVDAAFKYDTKVLVEEMVMGREFEVAVLGDESIDFKIKASFPGEVVISNSHEFYDYEAKYVDKDGVRLFIPAENLSRETVVKMQNLAIEVFKTLECAGIARVDMFLDFKESLVVNEINTLPGFTKSSMYLKLWEVSGLSFGRFLDELLLMAVLRHKLRSKLVMGYNLDGGSRESRCRKTNSRK